MKRISLLSLALLAAPILAATAAPRAVAPHVQRGAATSSAHHHDLSRPLRELVPPEYEFDDDPDENEHPTLPRSSTRGYAEGRVDPVLQDAATAQVVPTPQVSFDGLGSNFVGPAGAYHGGAHPPDNNGEVGLNHYVQIVNTSYAVFDKTGKPLFGAVPVNTLFKGFGGYCETTNDGDPVVLYDQLADRWVISQFANIHNHVAADPYFQCVAVSQTGDPTGAFYRYAFTYQALNDYPKMGIWSDGYYQTFNLFPGAGSTVKGGAYACAYDRKSMLTGGAATQQCFYPGNSFSVLPADLDGNTPPPAGSPEYLAARNGSGLNLFAFKVDWTNPANSAITGPIQVPVASYKLPACPATGRCANVPQGGTTNQLEDLADRLMFRLAYRNFGDHESLVVNHTVDSGNGNSGVRWYELRVKNGALDAATPVYQQGTYAPDAAWRWMGSVAMDKKGDIALGYSVSSGTAPPEVHYTGWQVGDPLGQMEGEARMVDGPGAQLTSGRWGDYSDMTVDPGDDCTFWYTTEYIAQGGSWNTRVSAFRFPSCGAATSDFSLSVTPGSLTLAPGASGTLAVTTAGLSGTPGDAIALAATGLPAGATATFSPASVQAGGGSTLTVQVGPATAAGAYLLTVSARSAQASHLTSVTLTVPGAGGSNDFSLTAAPTSVQAAPGASAQVALTTAITAGAAQAVALTASGLPAGVTASFSPASVQAGAGSQLTLAVGAAALAGTYPITVTGTGAQATHTAPVSLVVTGGAGAADFALTLSAPSASANLGASALVTVNTAAVSGAAQGIALTATGLPAGVTAAFSPASVQTGQGSQLTLQVSAQAQAGTSSVTITGKSPSATHTVQLSLVVGGSGSDFVIAAPGSGIVGRPGDAVAIPVITSASGAPLAMTLTVAGLPAGATASFAPARITAGASTTLVIELAPGTPPGVTELTVTGAAGSQSHSSSLPLMVLGNGDLDGNGVIDAFDLLGEAVLYLQTGSDPTYKPTANLAGWSESIDDADLNALLAKIGAVP